MREETSLDSFGEKPRKRGKFVLLAAGLAMAHVVLFFAPDLYLPFDLADRFLLGYGLVIADSGLLLLLGIKFLCQTLK